MAIPWSTSRRTSTTGNGAVKQRSKCLQSTTHVLTALLVASCCLNLLYLSSHIQQDHPPKHLRHLSSSSSSSSSSSHHPNTTTTTTTTASIRTFNSTNKDTQESQDVSHLTTLDKSASATATSHNITIPIPTNESSSTIRNNNDSSTNDDNDSLENPTTKATAYARLQEEQYYVATLLQNAGVSLATLDHDTLSQLPTWQQVQTLYYHHHHNNNDNDNHTTQQQPPPTPPDHPEESTILRPIVYGLDTCQDFRHNVPVDRAVVGLAGLFNTGTNALTWTLEHNFVQQQPPTRWQVPWGKHRLAKVKWTHNVSDHMGYMSKTDVLPIVIIKDPFTWLQSMCKSPYATKWRHHPGHCPNLVPNDFDRKEFPALAQKDAVPVKIEFDKNSTVYWDSLVHLWNDWYLQYYHADYPRLMVRFEDLLFAPKQLLRIIADCVGADVVDPMRYHAKSAKTHGSHTDLVGAMIKFGTGRGRLANMTQHDLDFADATLDDTLLRVFDYPTSTTTTKTFQQDRTNDGSVIMAH